MPLPLAFAFVPKRRHALASQASCACAGQALSAVPSRYQQAYPLLFWLSRVAWASEALASRGVLAQGVSSSSAGAMSDGEDIAEFAIDAGAETTGKRRPHAGSRDIQCTNCTRMYEVSRCLNAGDKAYASWRCKPCHNAIRLLERAIESKGSQAKEQAQLMRRVRKDQWRRLVCSIRIAHADDEMNEFDRDESLFGGADSSASFGVHKVIDSSISDIAVKTDIIMLSKRQFKAHFMQTELYTKDEAETFWHRCVGNPDYYREVDDGVLSLAVKLPKVFSSSASVSRSKQVEERKGVSNIAEVAKHVRSAAECTHDLRPSNPAFVCFQPGSFVEVDDTDDKKSSILSKDNLARMGLPNSEMYTPPSKRARSWVEMSQHLSSAASGCGDGDAASSVGDGDQGVVNLVKVRADITGEAKRILNQIVEKKSGSSRALREMVERLGSEHADVKQLGLLARFVEFDAATETLKQTLATAKNWTQGSVLREADKAWAAMNSLEKLEKDFTEALGALKKVRKQEVCSSSIDKRRLGTHIRQVLGKGALTIQGVPKAFVFWLGEVVLKVQVGSYSIDDRLKFSAGMNACMRPDTTLTELFLLPASDQSAVAKGLRSMRELMQKQVDKATRALRNHLDKNESVYFNIAKVGLKGDMASAFMNLSWLPAELGTKTSGLRPTNLSTFGEPFVTMQRKWAFRSGIDYIPYLGLGGFAHGVSGHVTIVSWPMSALLAAGADPTETDTFFNGLTNADFHSFMGKNAMFFELGAGDVTFIPLVGRRRGSAPRIGQRCCGSLGRSAASWRLSTQPSPIRSWIT